MNPAGGGGSGGIGFVVIISWLLINLVVWIVKGKSIENVPRLDGTLTTNNNQNMRICMKGANEENKKYM